jgi:hypothetical protein
LETGIQLAVNHPAIQHSATLDVRRQLFFPVNDN